jgi:hypothetical protein
LPRERSRKKKHLNSNLFIKKSRSEFKGFVELVNKATKMSGFFSLSINEIRG